MTAPCHGCCRVHRGPRCLPTDARSVTLAISFPGWVARELCDRLAWGERSGFVARAVAEALEGQS
jgi:hypothetical protein